MSEIAKVEVIARDVEAAKSRIGRLRWIMYTTGFDQGLEEETDRLASVYKDKGNYETLLAHLDRELAPLNRRRVELLRREFEPYQMSPELNEIHKVMRDLVTRLSQVLNTFRFSLEGREVPSTRIFQILANHPDRARRKEAHTALAQVNEPLVEGGFIDLVKARKDFARAYGMDDFVTYVLERNELGAGFFDDWTDAMHELAPDFLAARADFGQRYVGDPRVRRWDISYIGSKLAPQMSRTVDMSGFKGPLEGLLSSMGITLSDYNITYDIFPRRNKSEWGYNFTIEKGKDSRVLANVENQYREFGVLLHETGHAIHSFSVDNDDVLMTLGISPIISEGIANFFGSYLTRPEFYRPFFPDDPDQTERNFAELKRWHRINQVASIHSVLVDRAFYLRDVETIDDIHQIIWDLYKDLWDLDPYADAPAWAFRIHHTSNPIYLHNYLLGTLTGDLMEKAFRQQHGEDAPSKDPKGFWQFILDQAVKPSGAYSYPELFKRIAGEPFSLAILKDWLGEEG